MLVEAIARPANLPALLKEDGDTSRLISEFDWSGSLGPIETWPESLKTAVGLLVHSPVPIVLLWGEDGIMIYNDAYSVFAGERHPELLGSSPSIVGHYSLAAFGKLALRKLGAGEPS